MGGGSVGSDNWHTGVTMCGKDWRVPRVGKVGWDHMRRRLGEEHVCGVLRVGRDHRHTHNHTEVRQAMMGVDNLQAQVTILRRQ